jgi:cytosine/adenosine deaminase-related metal-dependent hydrolase
VLGARTRSIGVDEALRAITLGAAYTLKLDGEIGSIECGKRADFCVLEDDPTRDRRRIGAQGRAHLGHGAGRPGVRGGMIGGFPSSSSAAISAPARRRWSIICCASAAGRRIAVLVNDFGAVSRSTPT